MKESCQADN